MRPKRHPNNENDTQEFMDKLPPWIGVRFDVDKLITVISTVNTRAFLRHFDGDRKIEVKDTKWYTAVIIVKSGKLQLYRPGQKIHFHPKFLQADPKRPQAFFLKSSHLFIFQNLNKTVKKKLLNLKIL
jgi:hypothetical protein